MYNDGFSSLLLWHMCGVVQKMVAEHTMKHECFTGIWIGAWYPKQLHPFCLKNGSNTTQYMAIFNRENGD